MTPAAPVSARIVGADERSYWDEQVQTLPGVHPFHAFEWGSVRAVDGWRAVHVLAERGGAVSGALGVVAALAFWRYDALTDAAHSFSERSPSRSVGEYSSYSAPDPSGSTPIRRRASRRR